MSDWKMSGKKKVDIEDEKEKKDVESDCGTEQECEHVVEEAEDSGEKDGSNDSKDGEEISEEFNEMAKLTEELEAEKDKYLRLNAEFQNYRKRVEKEKTDLIKFGNEKILIDLLKVLDNMDRAVESSEDSADTKLREGILLIKKSFDDVLSENGVEEIEALGQPFDHDLHYAVAIDEESEAEPNTVVDVVQKGYKLNGKVVRHSMVRVSKSE